VEGVTGRMHSRKKVSQCSLRVLRSSRAVQVNVAIMRAFVKLRQVAADYASLAQKLDELERRCDTHDHSIKLVFGTLKKFFQPPARPHPRIGFVRQGRARVGVATRLEHAQIMGAG